jgi:tetratricopeptide (TPR) repeat protein
MAGKIFINYRRDADSIPMAGRLQDRLAQTFGPKKIFMDVDHIPVGADFVKYLNSQVAECDAMLVVIGPNWLNAKDESGGRRLDNPDDFVALEIAAALARDIPVIPVLVDGARMPKESELPDSLKLLHRRQAVEVRHGYFGRDAEALIGRMLAVLGNEGRSWKTVGARLGFNEARPWKAAGAALGILTALALLIWMAEIFRPPSVNSPKDASAPSGNIGTVSNGAKGSSEGRVSSDGKKSGTDGQGRYTPLPGQGRYTPLPGQDRYADLLSQGNTDSQAGNYDRAITSFGEAIRVKPEICDAYVFRGNTYARKGEYRLAIADYTSAIRINPKDVEALCNRGRAKLEINDASGHADIKKARQLLDPSVCQPGDEF